MTKLLKFLLQLLLLGILFGQLGRLPIGQLDGGIYLSDIAMFVLVVVWALWQIKHTNSMKIDPLLFSLGLFIMALLISLVSALNWTGFNDVLVGFFYWARLTAYLLLLPITASLKAAKDPIRGDIRNHTTNVITMFAVAGIAQYLFFPDFSQYVQHGWDPHYYRVLSTFFDPNFAGLMLLFGLLVILNHLYRQVQLLELFKLVIISSAFLLTFSRSAYLAGLIALIFFAILKDKRLLLAIFIACTISFAAIPRVRDRVIGAVNLDQTAQFRLENYRQTWKIIQDYPILGTGFNTYRAAQQDYGYFRDERGVNQSGGHSGAGADSSILFLLATSGLIGLGTFVFWVWNLFASAWHSPNRALLIGLLAGFIAHGQFVNSIFFPWLLGTFLIIFGIEMIQNE